MKSNCPVCLQYYNVDKFIFCNECYNLVCVHCSKEIKKRNNKCPLCRTTYRWDMDFNDLVRFLLIIDDHNKTKELRACVYTLIITLYNKTRLKGINRKDAMIKLIMKAFNDFGEEIPVFLFEFLTIIDIEKARGLCVKSPNLWEVFEYIRSIEGNKDLFFDKINTLRGERQYVCILVQLKPLILENNDRAIEILLDMKKNKEGDQFGNCKKYYNKIFNELEDLYPGKYGKFIEHRLGAY